MHTKEERDNRLMLQFIAFRAVFILVNFLFWGFYAILLYKSTQSFVILALDQLVAYVALYIGYLWGGIMIDKQGYLKTLRISFLLFACSLIFMLVLLPQMGALFVLFAISRALPRGIYWAVDASFMLKENHGQKRHENISIMYSLALIMGVLVPVVAGGLITYTGGYEFSLLLGAFVYLVAATVPWDYNKVPRSSFRTSEVVKIARHKDFPEFAFVQVISSLTDMVSGLLFFIIPYLIIGNELGVGILGSFVGLAGAAVLYTKRKDKFDSKLKVGVISYVIETISTLGFAAIWTLPALAVRNLIASFTLNLGDSAYEDADYDTRELILGKDKNESAVEMNFISQSLWLVGRVVSLVAFILFMIYMPGDREKLIRIFVACLLWVNIFSYLLMIRLRKKLRKKKSVVEKIKKVKKENGGKKIGRKIKKKDVRKKKVKR